MERDEAARPRSCWWEDRQSPHSCACSSCFLSRSIYQASSPLHFKHLTSVNIAKALHFAADSPNLTYFNEGLVKEWEPVWPSGMRTGLGDTTRICILLCFLLLYVLGQVTSFLCASFSLSVKWRSQTCLLCRWEDCRNDVCELHVGETSEMIAVGRIVVLIFSFSKIFQGSL